MKSSAFDIVKSAVDNDSLDSLLLGRPSYNYLPKWSPAPGNTDITALLHVLYDSPLGVSRETLRDSLFVAVQKIVDSYEGLFPVATVILVESLAKRNGHALGLPLEAIANALRKAVKSFWKILEADHSGDGQDWPDGCLGDLRRLSKNITEIGGPPIVEEVLNEDQ